ncbi:phage Gp37/Gp68 family protein [Nocardia sp. 2]|uniref:Phage Gp37/Gp68 family protein n=1 Tax=Nocardia acididurans TaxID=2802282 RepID=A0ABS1MFQ5_9NOCA|nr:phage Gp37/Gp68 family protein [Nocardia acididurans]MBL1079490.1 phage Gp37/Gp68 family protein [Nocardia acididurans]
MTGIEWTQVTWNPVTGCDRISTGCDHCYALAMAKRLQAMGTSKYQADGDPRTSGPGFGIAMHDAALRIPDRWRQPRLVFVNSMSDLFHGKVTEDFIRAVFDVIADTPQHTYQVLTKRPGRARRLAARGLVFPRNLWVGTSIENAAVTHRVDALLEVPAALRFLSCEPLLGPIDLDKLLFRDRCPDGCGCRRPDDADRFECACGGPCAEWRPRPALDWVIVGGESGPKARPVQADWVRDLRDQTLAAGVPFFFKQWGGRTPQTAGRELDGRRWDQMPTPKLPVSQ